jgi:thymidylate synthase
MKNEFTHSRFATLLMGLPRQFREQAVPVKGNTWQGVDVSKRPEMVTYDLINWSCKVPLLGIEELDYWQKDINPNLPWADDHFEERVCGYPINPGVEWANWPWGKSAAEFLEGGMFDHNYMERYWPKYAGNVPAPTKTAGEFVHSLDHSWSKVGVRFNYGDLNDLVQQLANDPTTRQAYLPLYFPEDTGRNGRKPCSLGYQFWAIDNRFYVWYPMRSCDAVRHLPDDIYLTLRLMLWVLNRCRSLRPDLWTGIKPHSFAMHASRLHVFENDFRQFQNQK